MSDPRKRPPRSPVVRDAPRSASIGFDRDPTIAGATPKSAPVTSDAPNAKAITRQRRRGIDRNVGRAAERQVDDGARAGERHDEAGHAAGARQQDAFEEELADQPGPGGAERDTHGGFGPPAPPLAQQQAGEVCAGDEEDRRREHLQQAQ